MWTFASAYRILKDPRYLEMANHAKDYIKEHFVDKEYGGAYWVVDAQGNPADESKYPYGIAFIIYGGAELARASGSKDGLKLARDMYEALENMPWIPNTGDTLKPLPGIGKGGMTASIFRTLPWDPRRSTPICT